MARISLRSVIDDTLIKRFQGLASTSSSSTGFSAASASQASSTSIESGLRVGARTFATAVQGLNTAITFLNTSKSSLEVLGGITDKMIDLAERASSSSSSRQERHDANTEFQRLANQFQSGVSNAKLGDREVLNIEDISEYLTLVGLDKEQSDSIASLFDKFTVPAEDSYLASEEPQAERPIKIPAGAYTNTSRTTSDYSALFDSDVSLETRPNAYKVLADLKALRNQIDDNSKALDSGIEIIAKNIDLVRAAGLAFLDLSSQINSTDEADQVAIELQDKIRQDAPGALSQADNLESIIVAALALNPDELGLS